MGLWNDVDSTKGEWCLEEQEGCASEPCDYGDHTWCKIANPGCATERYLQTSHCDWNNGVVGKYFFIYVIYTVIVFVN